MTMMVHNQVEVSNFKKQLKNPTAKKYQLNISGIKRDFFLFHHNKGKNNSPNNWLFLILSGSGCSDEQPLLGFLYQGLPINSDIAIIQKRGVEKGARYAANGYKCTKSYYLHNNHVNRAQANLALIKYLKKRNSYKRITLLGGSEGVQIAYLMMTKDPTLNEAVFLSNHAANSIKGAYDAQAIFRNKRQKDDTLKRYKKLNEAIKQKGMGNHVEYSNYVKNWKITFNSDRRNMGEVLSRKKNNRYLFIMGDNDDLLPSQRLKETKKIFCRNKHNNNLMLYKNNSDHMVLSPPREPLFKVIRDWLNKKPYQENSKFTVLTCN